ncbi:ArsR/SmtB family transcription factor [Actinokineospora globicatena]|uniref:Transcriptional regulator n=1 Tax=Actinokineospora globicatena TaxID=103729 RepID=A0A9W6V9H6_9PSEU|nr:metalloregulator ArsR/SmtB family transcription factor [Actinokineospora globicatena]MCP2306003.1 transcriptional regulator, ArsR family [Actinokineospora globicatena]GLW80125.1 transcriptional regulator [Actinokineospora globicatena]GLW86954.1 transcriptional regulator [Actinokineospora globicatena]GLW93317.1 transcriptional regulator [Actinokineospora globicatena]
MRDNQSRPDLFEELARVGKALGNGKRLELIDLLAQGERGVVDLATTAGLTVTTTSAHLQTLKHAGLVASNRDGTTIRYRLASAGVTALYSRLLEVAAAQLADVDIAARRYLGPEDTEAIGRDELLRRVGAGEAIVVDVRPATEFSAGHIPGALSIPLDELVERLDELPAGLEVVAYCRGIYCAFSHDAVRLLNSAGRRAVRLADGILEWQVAGNPLATADDT